MSSPRSRAETAGAVALLIVLVSAIAAFAVYSKHRRAEILATGEPDQVEPVPTAIAAAPSAPPAMPRPSIPRQPEPPASSGPPDSRGCYKPTPPARLTATPEVAAALDGLSRVVAKGYFGVDAGEATDTPEKMAADLEKRLKAHEAHPGSRLQSCMDRISAVRRANPKRPIVECIHTIDVCADARGGPGCCPRACISLYERLCAGGKCSDPKREIEVLFHELAKGECVAGYAEALAPIRKMNEDHAARQARDARASYAFVVAGESGAVVANRPDGLVRSHDDGQTWTPINAGLETIDARLLVEGAAGRLFAASYNALFRWVEGERRWRPVERQGPSGPRMIEQLVVDRGGRLVARADSYGEYGVWVSRDEGSSWQRLPEMGPGVRVNAIALAPDGQLVTGARGDKPIARWRGVDSWDLVPLRERIGAVEHIWPLPNGRILVEGFDVSLIEPDGAVVHWTPPRERPKGVLYAHEMKSILATAVRQGRIYAIRVNSHDLLMQSSDGAEWTPVLTVPECGEIIPGKRRSCDFRGLAATRRGTLVLAARNRLLRSTDGGETWTVVRENE